VKQPLINEKYEKFYDLRSKLVHGRAVRLRDEDKGYLNWGENILKMVIGREILNLGIEMKVEDKNIKDSS
jgi:hypothetical protein